MRVGLRHGRQRELEARLVAQQRRQRNLAAGFVHVAPYQRHAGAVGRPARRGAQRRVAGLEDQLDGLAIAQARCGIYGDETLGDRGGADLIGIEAPAVVLKMHLEALVGHRFEFDAQRAMQRFTGAFARR